MIPDRLIFITRGVQHEEYSTEKKRKIASLSKNHSNIRKGVQEGLDGVWGD